MLIVLRLSELVSVAVLWHSVYTPDILIYILVFEHSKSFHSIF
jgi:hypothetical protein